MNFHQYVKAPRALRFSMIPLIDILFQLVFFLVLSSSFAAPLPIDVHLPKAVTSDIVNDNNISIIVSSENIFYYNNKVITLAGLKQLLSMPQNQGRPVLIKSDRRASFGRIVDVWDLARSSGVGRINVATDQGE